MAFHKDGYVLSKFYCAYKDERYPDEAQNLAMRTTALLSVWIKIRGRLREGGINSA